MSGSIAARKRCRRSARDPLARMQMWLLREGILDEEGINRLEQKVDEEVQRAADRALAGGAAECDAGGDSAAPVFGGPEADGCAVSIRSGQATADASERTMAELINHCLKDEMRRDERIVVFGEDVADATRDEALRRGRSRARAASSS
jgi:2-oxoisovalerate dehydrogenase E1 component